MMHLLSIVVLLLKITATKSCRGAQLAPAPWSIPTLNSPTSSQAASSEELSP